MTFNNILKWLEMGFQLSFGVMKIAIVLIGGLSIILAILITVSHIPAFLTKKVNLKQAENIMQHNLEIVEKATFFETSTEFNELIQKQMSDIRANEIKLKAQRAESTARDNEKANRPSEKGKK